MPSRRRIATRTLQEQRYTCCIIQRSYGRVYLTYKLFSLQQNFVSIKKEHFQENTIIIGITSKENKTIE
jgi:hypothetical protein